MYDDDSYLFKIILCALALLIILCIIVALTSACIDVSTMQQAGYSARRVNLSCIAEYQGRWLDCDTVLKNQVQVTK